MDSIRTRISSNFTFEIIFFLSVTLYLICLVSGFRVDVDGDFKKMLEARIALFVFLTGFVYFFTRPNIFYTKNTFIIRKFSGKEHSVLLENVISVFNNPFTWYNGYAILEIEYIDKELGTVKLKFNIQRTSKQLGEFIELIKKANPKVEIV